MGDRQNVIVEQKQQQQKQHKHNHNHYHNHNQHRRRQRRQEQHQQYHRNRRQQQKPVQQTIHVFLKQDFSKVQFSIKTDGPVDTTVVVEPSVDDENLSIGADILPSSITETKVPIEQRHTKFSSSGWNSPVSDLKPPPSLPIFNSRLPLHIVIPKDEPLELYE